MNKKNVRLSKDVVPVEYDIQLKPDLKNFTFDGIETISLSLLKPTKTLTLHSKEIEVDTASVVKGKEKTFAKISYHEKAETVTFTFLKPIPKGKTKLHVVFKGILNDKMRGFYRSKYIHQGEELHMATTQFEATDARRAFPCFDEPAQKAIFHVSLVVPKGKTAISNTLPTVVEEHEGGFEMIRFAPTPKMSTYLLAFIVGDFEFIEGKTKRGVQVRVFTVPGKKHQAGFALDCAIRTLDFYESYFDIKYPLPVLDMIAIPDFSAGAMENWGAITYRESALLIDEEHSSVSTRQWVALVIAHELAHQWFGNLVTMEWWTHLWLNEGFASYIEYLAVDKLFPHWDIWTQFSTNDLGVALRLDALYHTHPIEIPVHHPAEIGEIFDEVSYSKGASVIRMLAGYIGEQNFRDGLRYYLKKHSYKNTETVHLWEAFERVAKKPVASVMRTWTGKGGYPTIKAETKKDKLFISQERFLASPASKAKIKTKDLWQVPLVIGNGKKTDTSLLINRKDVKDLPKDWFKVNIGETGFYRTAYDKTILEKLVAPVQEKLLPPRDRLGIIRDLFALSEAGIIPTTDALEFLTAYKNEDNFTVWIEIATGLSRIEQMVANTPLEKKIEKMNLRLFSPLAQKLGWDKKKNEPHGDALLRSLAIGRAGRCGDKKIIAEAKKKFVGMKTGMKVNPDIRGAIYSIVAMSGGQKEFNEMIKRYKSETLHEERNRIGGVLGDFNDPMLLQKVPMFALSSDVRLQDTMGIFSSLGANPRGRDIWMKAIKDNWPTFVSRYGDGGHTLGRLLKSISGSAEYKHFKAFKDFFSKNEAPGAKRAVEQVLERMEGNILWCKRDTAKIKKLLS